MEHLGHDSDSESDDCQWRHRDTPSRNQHLLTSLRESIVDKPPISGTLQLPDSFFSFFYKVAKDGHSARFGDGDSEPMSVC
jgi:hypothetical protein